MPEKNSLNPKREIKAPATQAEADLSTASHDLVTKTHGKGTTDSSRRVLQTELPSHPNYEITSEIARGGMGRVLAGREIALDREVAIKTLLPGANAHRFVTEAKITARLPHPGIPPVYAFGTIADGSPFLAMKLVRGRTLAAELRESTNLQDDLSRFVHIFDQIAQAVGFAHAQGIIHRDLKPANIMVGAFGEVQVMDWGLARRLSDTDDESVTKSNSEISELVHTQAGDIIGTPAYMAPEQARGETVDARADVFALGGILASILTGHSPFRCSTVRETVAKAAAGDLRDVYARLEDCQAPEELIEIARLCLQADPADRPSDAEQLASIVSRYRDSVEKRLRQAESERAASEAKFAEQQKRRRVVRIAAGLVMGLLTLGTIGTSIGLVAANRAEKREAQRAEGERRERRRAEEQREAAIVAKTAAQNRLTQIEKGSAVLNSIFKDLDIQAVEQDGRDLKVVLARRLIHAADQIEGDAIGDPLVVADLQTQLATSLLGVGYFVEARELNEKALATRRSRLGADDAASIKNMHDISLCFRSEGRLDEAVSLLEKVCDHRKKELGPNNPLTISSLSNLVVNYRVAGHFDKAIALGEDTLPRSRAQLGNEDKHTIMCLNALATSYLDKGLSNRAVPLLEESLELSENVFGPNHPDTIVAMGNLATGYQDSGQRSRALPLYQETLESIRTKKGPDHPDTMTAIRNLAHAYRTAGRADLALPLAKEALALHKEKFGAQHSETLTSMSDLGSILHATGAQNEGLLLLRETFASMQEHLDKEDINLVNCMNRLAVSLGAVGKRDEAIPLLTESLARTRKRLGNDHPKTLKRMNDLAVLLRTDGQVDKAIPLLKEAFKATAEKKGEDHPDTLSAMDNLAQCYMSAGQLDLAIELFEEALKMREHQFGRENVATVTTLHNLAWAHYYSGKPEDALPNFQETLKFMKGNFGEEHPNAIVTMRSLATCYQKLGQLDEALDLLQESLTASKAKLGLEHAITLTAQTKLGEVCLDSGQPAKAEKHLAECLSIAKVKRPDSWRTFETQSLLGAALLAQSRLEEAEPLLLEGFAGLRDREASISKINRGIILDAIDRIIRLYAANKNSEKLEEWSAERESLRSRLSDEGLRLGD